MNHASNTAPVEQGSNANLNAQILALTMKLVAIMFIATGLVLEVSLLDPSSFDAGHGENATLSWVTAFYFIIITFSTVG